MSSKRPLHQLLPMRFRGGEEVRQFSKPCIRCGYLLEAKHMEGLMRFVENYLAIAAVAHCPKCRERFSVACVIDHKKRVRKVVLPAWLFSLYLRYLPQGADGLAGRVLPTQSKPERTLETKGPPMVSSQKAKQSETVKQQVICADESIGRYQGKPIPAWVIIDGKRLNFERLELGTQLKNNEFLLNGCLVYRGS